MLSTSRLASPNLSMSSLYFVKSYSIALHTEDTPVTTDPATKVVGGCLHVKHRRVCSAHSLLLATFWALLARSMVPQGGAAGALLAASGFSFSSRSLEQPPSFSAPLVAEGAQYFRLDSGYFLEESSISCVPPPSIVPRGGPFGTWWWEESVASCHASVGSWPSLAVGG